MAFRYYKRVGNKKGLGLNFSGSGVSTSYRGKGGSFGTNGFTIKTGIKGFYFRSVFSKKTKGLFGILFLLFSVFLAFIILPFLIIYNFFRLLVWIFFKIIYYVNQIKETRK